jgi:hypothetical protein
MEAERVVTSDFDIIHWYQKLSEIMRMIPSGFIYNMDETGCSEFVDSCELMVVVPDSYKQTSISVPVNRHTKRSTLTCCISADGLSLKPYVIIDRVTIDDQIILSGYGPHTAEFVMQPHAFMTMMLFDKWATDIFFPALRAKRKGQLKYEGRALLIMDGFGAHNTPAFNELCEKEKVIVKFLVPHTSDRCQALDSLVFASFKSHYARKRVDISDSQQTNRIIRLMRAWWAAMAPDIVVSSFKAVGIVPYLPFKDSRVFCKVYLTQSVKLSHLHTDVVLCSQFREKNFRLKLKKIDAEDASSDPDKVLDK